MKRKALWFGLIAVAIVKNAEAQQLKPGDPVGSYELCRLILGFGHNPYLDCFCGHMAQNVDSDLAHIYCEYLYIPEPPQPAPPAKPDIWYPWTWGDPNVAYCSSEASSCPDL